MSDQATGQSSYTMGYGEEFTQLLDRRSAQTNAARLLPHLKPGPAPSGLWLWTGDDFDGSRQSSRTR